jgi:hypothetical protein
MDPEPDLPVLRISLFRVAITVSRTNITCTAAGNENQHEKDNHKSDRQNSFHSNPILTEQIYG